MKIKRINPYSLFNGVIVANIHHYLEKDNQASDLELSPFAHRLRGQAWNHKAINSFDKKDMKEIVDSLEGQDEAMNAIGEIEISYVIFALELGRLLFEFVPKKHLPLLNISKEKMIMGKRIYVMEMIALKHRDKEVYNDKREIMDNSTKAAEMFFNFMKTNLTKGIIDE